jgi:hypothetical protein
MANLQDLFNELVADSRAETPDTFEEFQSKMEDPGYAEKVNNGLNQLGYDINAYEGLKKKEESMVESTPLSQQESEQPSETTETTQEVGTEPTQEVVTEQVIEKPVFSAPAPVNTISPFKKKKPQETKEELAAKAVPFDDSYNVSMGYFNPTTNKVEVLVEPKEEGSFPYTQVVDAGDPWLESVKKTFPGMAMYADEKEWKTASAQKMAKEENAIPPTSLGALPMTPVDISGRKAGPLGKIIQKTFGWDNARLEQFYTDQDKRKANRTPLEVWGSEFNKFLKGSKDVAEIQQAKEWVKQENIANATAAKEKYEFVFSNGRSNLNHDKNAILEEYATNPDAAYSKFKNFRSDVTLDYYDAEERYLNNKGEDQDQIRFERSKYEALINDERNGKDLDRVDEQFIQAQESRAMNAYANTIGSDVTLLTSTKEYEKASKDLRITNFKIVQAQKRLQELGYDVAGKAIEEQGKTLTQQQIEAKKYADEMTSLNDDYEEFTTPLTSRQDVINKRIEELQTKGEVTREEEAEYSQLVEEFNAINEQVNAKTLNYTTSWGKAQENYNKYYTESNALYQTIKEQEKKINDPEVQALVKIINNANDEKNFVINQTGVDAAAISDLTMAADRVDLVSKLNERSKGHEESSVNRFDDIREREKMDFYINLYGKVADEAVGSPFVSGAVEFTKGAVNTAYKMASGLLFSPVYIANLFAADDEYSEMDRVTETLSDASTVLDPFTSVRSDADMVDKILNATGGAAVQMAAMATGSGVLMEGGMGVMAAQTVTTFMSSFPMNYQDNINSGMNPMDARNIALMNTATDVLLEGIYGEGKIYKAIRASRSSAIKEGIKAGKNVDEIMADFYKSLPKEVADKAKDVGVRAVAIVEGAALNAFEETTQMVGQKATNRAYNYINDGSVAEVETNGEEVILTTVPALLLGGAGNATIDIASTQSRDALSEGILYVGANSNNFLSEIEKQVPDFYNENKKQLEEISMVAKESQKLPGYANLDANLKAHVLSETIRKKNLEAAMKNFGLEDPKTKEEIANIDTEIKQILAGEKTSTITETPQENAVQEPSTGEVLQRQPQEVGETGGQRKGVEPVLEGQSTTQEVGKEEVIATPQEQKEQEAMQNDIDQVQQSTGTVINLNEDGTLTINAPQRGGQSKKDAAIENAKQELTSLGYNVESRITQPQVAPQEVGKEEIVRDEAWDENAKESLPESSFPDRNSFIETIKNGVFGLLTAWNPQRKSLSDEENAKRNEVAKSWLEARGYSTDGIFGKYGNSEKSFIVPNLSRKDAVDFAVEFDQESVATHDGLVYQDGSYNPRIKGSEKFEPQTDNYSTINLAGERLDFAIEYDFNTLLDKDGNKIETPKQQETQFSTDEILKQANSTGYNISDTNRTKEVSKLAKTPKQRRIVDQAIKAVKTLKSILPNFEMVVFDNEADFKNYANSIGANEDSKGLFTILPEKESGVIAINLEAANLRTVAHEMTHAVLFKMFGEKPELYAQFKNKIAELAKGKKLKSINENGEEIEISIDDIAADLASNEAYDDVERAEEYMSELTAVLSNLKESDPATKSFFKSIAEYINQLIAKYFGPGLKPIDDTSSPEEIMQFFQTLANKVYYGEEIKIDNEVAENVDTSEEVKSKYALGGSFEANLIPESDLKKLEDDGYLIQNAKIEELEGEVVISMFPDNKMVGDLSYGTYDKDTEVDGVKYKKGDKRVVLEGNGGLHFAIKYNEDGTFWASTPKMSKTFINLVNKIFDKYPGKPVRVVVFKSTDLKVLSSRDGMAAAIDILELAVQDGDIPLSVFRNALNTAVKEEKDNEGIKLFSGKLSAKELHSVIKDYFINSNDETFKKRVNVGKKIIAEIFKSNEIDFSSLSKKLNIPLNKSGKITVDVATKRLGNVQEEGFMENAPAESAVAYIEIPSKLIVEDESDIPAKKRKHISYPGVMKTEDGQRVTVHMLSERKDYKDILSSVKDGEVRTSEKIENDNTPLRDLDYAANFAGARNIPYSVVRINTGIKSKSQAKAGESLVDKAKLTKDMTEDDQGNYLFYHYSPNKISSIDPKFFGKNTGRTGKDERPGLNISMYYTRPDVLDVSGRYGYVVRIPKDNVYPFNEDPLNLYDAAKATFEKMYPGQTFDPNKQAAFIAQEAAKLGYPMIVVKWGKDLRAETTEKMKGEFYQRPDKDYPSAVEFNPALEMFEANEVLAKKSGPKSKSQAGKDQSQLSKEEISIAEQVAGNAKSIMDTTGVSQADAVNKAALEITNGDQASADKYLAQPGVKEAVNNKIKQIKSKTERELEAESTEITMSERKLLTDRVKAEVKAALEGRKEGKKEGVDQAKEQAQKTIDALNKKLEDGKITKQELQDRIKELGYNIRFEAGVARLAGEKTGKSMGKKVGEFVGYFKGLKAGRTEQRGLGALVSEYIKDVIDNELGKKGTVSPATLKSIARRAATISNQKQLDAFVSYLDKVIANRRLAEGLNEIKKLQKQLLNKVGYQYTSNMKMFAKFDMFTADGDLAFDMDTMTEYLDALRDLTSDRVPKIGKMMELFDGMYDANQQNQPNDIDIADTIEKWQKSVDKLFDKDKTINDFEEYKSFKREVGKYMRALNTLLETGAISEAQYEISKNKVIEDSANTDTYASEFQDQIDDLKNILIQGITDKSGYGFMDSIKDWLSNSPNSFTENQKKLIDQLMRATPDNLMTLSLEDLDLLNQVTAQIAEAGFVDEKNLRTLLDRAEIRGNEVGKSLVEQSQKVRNKYSNPKNGYIKMMRDTLGKSVVFWESRLGMKENGAFRKNLVDPIVRAINGWEKDSQRILKKYQKKVESLRSQKILKNVPGIGKLINRTKIEKFKLTTDGSLIPNGTMKVSKDAYDRVMIGVVGHILDNAWNAKQKKKTVNDWLGKQMLSAEERNKMQNEDVNELDIVNNIYNDLKKMFPDGNGGLDHMAVLEAFETDPTSILTSNQLEYYNAARSALQEAGEYINSASGIRNQQHELNPYYMPRQAIGTGKAALTSTDISYNKNVGAAIRSGASYQRVLQVPAEAIRYNVDRLVMTNVNEGLRDYYLTDAKRYVKEVFSNAQENASSDEVVMLNNLKQLSDTIAPFALQKAESTFGLSKLMGKFFVDALIGIVRTPVEFTTNLISYAVGNRSSKSLTLPFSSKEKQQTENLLSEFDSSVQFTGMEKKVKLSGKKGVDSYLDRESNFGLINKFLNNITGFMRKGEWMSQFERDFQNNTGEKFNYEKHFVKEKAKYYDDMNIAASNADFRMRRIMKGGNKAEQRQFIEWLPLVKQARISADSYAAPFVGMFSGFINHDADNLIGGLRKAVTRGEIKDGLTQSLGAYSRLALYPVLMVIGKAVAALNLGDDDEKEEAKETLDSLKTAQGWIDLAIFSAKQVGATLVGGKYAAGGKVVGTLLLDAAYTMSEDRRQRRLIENTMRELYFVDPIDFYDLPSEKDDIALQISANLEPIIGMTVDAVADFVKDVRNKGREQVTLYDIYEWTQQTDEGKQWMYMANSIATLGQTLTVMFTPGAIPFIDDYVRWAEDKLSVEKIDPRTEYTLPSGKVIDMQSLILNNDNQLDTDIQGISSREKDRYKEIATEKFKNSIDKVKGIAEDEVRYEKLKYLSEKAKYETAKELGYNYQRWDSFEENFVADEPVWDVEKITSYSLYEDIMKGKQMNYVQNIKDKRIAEDFLFKSLDENPEFKQKYKDGTDGGKKGVRDYYKALYIFDKYKLPAMTKPKKSDFFIEERGQIKAHPNRSKYEEKD